MGLVISCPLPASLKDVPAQSCPFRFDQIVRFGFQRRQTVAPFTTLSAAQTKTNWTTLKAATDDTKVVFSPIVTSTVIPRSEALTTGGNDNSTFNGIREYNGEGAVTVSAQIKNAAPSVIRALQLLSQESIASGVGATNLGVFLFNNSGHVFLENPANGDTPTTNYQAIPIYNFRISSPGSEGFNSPNINDVQFDLPANWADYIADIKPAFDPLTEL